MKPKYTLKDKFQILIGTHPETYPKESSFQYLSEDEQRAANLEAAKRERQNTNQNGSN